MCGLGWLDAGACRYVMYILYCAVGGGYIEVGLVGKVQGASYPGERRETERQRRDEKTHRAKKSEHGMSMEWTWGNNVENNRKKSGLIDINQVSCFPIFRFPSHPPPFPNQARGRAICSIEFPLFNFVNLLSGFTPLQVFPRSPSSSETFFQKYFLSTSAHQTSFLSSHSNLQPLHYCYPALPFVSYHLSFI